MKSRKHLIWPALLVVFTLLLAGCGSGGATGGTGSGTSAATGVAGGANETAAAPVANPAAGATSTAVTSRIGSANAAVTLRYALWDASQKPPYEQCATAFTKQNPNIAVQVEQLGWGDYWNAIQTGFVGGTAPDVFTDHLAKYPEFALKNQLVDIAPLVQQDKVDTNQYLKGLADLWVREGKRYGLPKDWDTIAVVYNADMLKQAGVDPASLKDLTWNPDDGGTFSQLIGKLTLDKNGKNGLDPAFDKKNVVQYGFIPQGSGGFAGQTQWSNFAASAGFKFIDQTWGAKYYYDDPVLAKTVQWYADLNLKQGWAPPLSDITSLGASTLFTSGKGALTTDGSWMINTYTGDAKFKVGFAPLPTGPKGRKSMFNGLADSIWTGTKYPKEAWQLVKFLASPECENIVGQSGVVFPAIQSGIDASLKTKQAKGIDATAFTDEAKDPNGTFLFPITANGAEIDSIMSKTMDSIMLGQAKAADALKAANQEVNNLFK